MALITPAAETASSGQMNSTGNTPLPDVETVLEASADALVMLPNGRFASDAVYQQQGDDLVLTAPDGATVVVEGYFLLDPPPDLLTPEGGRLTPVMVDSFTPPESAGRYAQAGQLAQSAEPIGQVSDLTGQVFAVRADGTRVQLSAGDAVFQGDVVETAAGGAINMIFVDDTTFALGADARLALDEMVYNPSTQAGSSSFSVLKGVFVFVSGQIANTDSTQMTVTTPVATIGIRGTKVAGDVRPADEESRFTVIDGEIAISTQGGTVVMSEANTTTVITNFLAPPSPPVVYTQDQLNSAYNSVRSVSDYTSPSNNSGQNNAGENGEDPSDVSPEAGDGDDGGENGDGGGEDGSDGAGDAEIPDQIDVGTDFGKLKDPLPKGSEEPLGATPPQQNTETVVPPPAPDETGQDDVADEPDGDEDITVTDFSLATEGQSFTGGDGPDVIIGSAFNDVLDGGGGDDIILGGDGDDIVSGGAGNDTLIAGSGAGNDAYDGGDGSDSLVYSSTSQGIAVSVASTPRSGSVTGQEIDSDTFQNIEAIIGGAGPDSFAVGSVGGMFFVGGAGNDSLSYAPVTSALTVNLGAGTVSSGTLSGLVTDTFSGFESFTGGSAGDSIRGSGGNDNINGGGGNDTIFGSGGNDQINGGSGSNTLVYDTISGVQIDFEAGTVSGAGFIDTFTNINSAFVTSGVVNVIGSSNSENFGGGTGDDIILGGGGDDTISGNEGNDFLDGGTGADTVTGGAGDDTVVFDDQDIIEGGLGNDTLLVEGSGQTIDFGQTFIIGQSPAQPNMSGIETISLTGSGSHTLFVEASDILERSNTGTLMLTGDSSNQIVSNTNWVDEGVVSIGEITFQKLTADGATFLTEVPFDGNSAVNFTNALDNNDWASVGNWQRSNDQNLGPPVDGGAAALFSGATANYDFSAGTTALASISGTDDLVISGGQLTVDEASVYNGNISAPFGNFGGDGAIDITGVFSMAGGEGGPTLFGTGGINAVGNMLVAGFTTVQLDTTLTYRSLATIDDNTALVGTGLLVGAGGSTLNLSSSFLTVDFDNDGLVNIGSGAFIDFRGDVTNTGTFRLNLGGSSSAGIDFGSTGAFLNAGLVDVSNSQGLSIFNGLFNNDGGNILFNNSNVSFENSTLIFDSGDIAGSNGGLFFNNSNVILNTDAEIDADTDIFLDGASNLSGTGILTMLSGSTLIANSGTATVATDIVNAGTVALASGAELNFSGTALTVQAGGVLIVDGDLTFRETAGILAAGSNLQIAAGARIDLLDNSDLALDTDFTLLSGRTIGLGAGNGAASLTGTGVLTNQGNLEFSGGILGVDTVNTGAITTTDNTYTVDSILTLNEPGSIDLSGSKILAGTGTYESFGTLSLSGDTIAANFVQQAGELDLFGNITVDGVLQFGAAASINYGLDVLDGAGTLVNHNDFEIFSRDIDVLHVVNEGRIGFGDVTLTGSEIINTATGIFEIGLDGGGAINMEAGETTTNAGLIDILDFNTFDFLGGVLENSGVINIGDGSELAILSGTLSMLDGGALTGTGSVTLATELNIGAGVIYVHDDAQIAIDLNGGEITGPGTLTNQSEINFNDGAGLNLEFTNTGVMTLAGAGTNVFNIVGASENLAGGVMTINSAAVFDMGGAGVFTNNGNFILNTFDPITVQEGEFLNDTNGILSGFGSITVGTNGTFTQNGTDDTGLSPGEITIVGNVTRGDSSHMITELAGLAPATEFDVYNVTGAMDLAGTMTVQQIDDFAVDIGDSFAVVNAGQLNGSFHEINGLDGGGGVVIDAEQSATGITLTGVAVTHQGDGGDNTLTGGGDDVFSAGDGNDTIVSNGGHDLMHGGDGDDVFILQDTGFGRIDGGNGFDLVTFDGAGESFDLTALRGDQFSSIEALDLTGTGDNALLLDCRIAFAATSGTNAATGTSHSLIIDGDTGDSVTFQDSWSNTGSVTIGGNGYSVYQSVSHDAQVFVDDSVAINAAAA